MEVDLLLLLLLLPLAPAATGCQQSSGCWNTVRLAPDWIARRELERRRAGAGCNSPVGRMRVARSLLCAASPARQARRSFPPTLTKTCLQTRRSASRASTTTSTTRSLRALRCATLWASMRRSASLSVRWGRGGRKCQGQQLLQGCAGWAVTRMAKCAGGKQQGPSWAAGTLCCTCKTGPHLPALRTRPAGASTMDEFLQSERLEDKNSSLRVMLADTMLARDKLEAAMRCALRPLHLVASGNQPACVLVRVGGW